MGKRWVRRPEGSTWGEFGEDDQRGRLNLLTEERVRTAVTEAKAGEKLLPEPAARLSGRQQAQPPASAAAQIRHAS